MKEKPQYNLAEKMAFARQMRKAPTQTEAILWDHLRKNQVGYSFQRQRVIYGYIVDFWCPKARLAIEVDGSVHEKQEVMANDEQKEQALASYNIALLRFSNDEVLLHLKIVLANIKRECDYRMQQQ